MLKIKEAIVVEGRYDKNTLSQLVDAPIIETKGFGIMKDRALLAFLREVALKRGLIILTDSDGAGFVIRNYLKGSIPEGTVKHAYIPDIPGREPRKQKPGKEGKLGVEGMSQSVLREALLRAGATVDDSEGPAMRKEITKQDLFELHLTGWPDSSSRRAQLKQQLKLPAHLSTNGLLDALNLMFEREEFIGGDE